MIGFLTCHFLGTPGTGLLENCNFSFSHFARNLCARVLCYKSNHLHLISSSSISPSVMSLMKAKQLSGGISVSTCNPSLYGCWCVYWLPWVAVRGLLERMEERRGRVPYSLLAE